VETATNDQRDAFGNAESGDRVAIGCVECDFKRRGAVEGNGGFGIERGLFDAGTAREDGTVGDKGDQLVPSQLGTQRVGVFIGFDGSPDFPTVEIFETEAIMGQLRQVVTEDAGGLAASDAAAAGGQADRQPDFNGVIEKEQRSPCDHFLAGGVNGDQARFPRSRPRGNFLACGRNDAGKVVFQSDATGDGAVAPVWKTRHRM
jgi:hypothetical protein